LKYWPLKELILARAREFFREPEAIFWVYGFPVILMFGLGIAFRTGSDEVHVDIVAGDGADEARAALAAVPAFKVSVLPLDEARKRYAAAKTDLIVEVVDGGYRYTLDPSKTGAEASRVRVNDALQAAAGRRDPRTAATELITEPGSRYIDWLIPGLLGMNIMGGGLWGLGFVTVDLRMRKLLKRFVATPMRRGDFLLALMVSRLLFLIPEITAILAVGHFAFGLRVQGSLGAVLVVILVGAASFAGLGLLIACRTDKIETVSGLLNLIMLPMWLLSGIFFASSRFPEAMQPFVQALPLTQLNIALRGVILEGAPLAAQGWPLLILTVYGVVSFAAALRWFKWQ
jgi:ABC-type multidrug transport system permease subunit